MTAEQVKEASMIHEVIGSGFEYDSQTPYVNCKCGAGLRGLTNAECYINWAIHALADYK